MEMDRANGLIHSDWAHQLGINGAGVTVAVLDSGCRPDHPDFKNGRGESRILAFRDFVSGRRECYDDAGHGTHVAGILGGNGALSKGRYVGVAPECNLVILKVLDYMGRGDVPVLLDALAWIEENQEKYQIRVVNISVGTRGPADGGEDSSLVRGVERIWDRGLVVVAAAGNQGPAPGSIGSPGISRKIITVGASDDDIPIQVNGRKIRNYSGCGPTRYCIRKPDLVAPGSRIVSCAPNGYQMKSGTSMSTPMVSGAVALLLSGYPQMDTRAIKIRLKNSCTPVSLPRNKQGWGMLDVQKMLSVNHGRGYHNHAV